MSFIDSFRYTIEFTQVSNMQEYRINFPLLIGLIVGGVVFAGAILGIHAFQTSRQSGWLLDEAEKAIANKNYVQASQYYQQYTAADPNNMEAKIKLADTYLDLLESDNPDPDYIPSAMQSLEMMLRGSAIATAPEAKGVRKRLVKFYGKDNVRNFSGALDHLKILLEGERDPKQLVDLQVLRATYLAKSGNIDDAVRYSYELIGYDPKADSFDTKKAAAPHATEVYSLLAAILRSKQSNSVLAGRIANQMVDANSKDASAYVYRSRLLAQWGDDSGARSDAEKAYQLKPEDADVLLLITDIAAQDKQFDKAGEYMASAQKHHPKDPRVYQRAASLEMQQGKVDKALAQLDAGAKAVGSNAATNILFVKARLQIESNDLKGARHTIEDMQKDRKLIAEVNDYFEALFLVAESKWYAAAEALNKLRPRMELFGKEMATEIDFSLALCYERLGRYELAKQYYDLIVQKDSRNAPAVAGTQRMAAALGVDRAKTSSGPDPLQEEIAKMLKLPKEQQNWSNIEKQIDELAEKNKLAPSIVALLKAQVALMREDFDRAAQIVLAAEKEDPKSLQLKRFKLQLARLNPKIGPAKALEYWQRLADEFGDLPGLRLDKADILISLNKDKADKEQLKQDLAGLAAGIDNWTTAQKVELWNGIARDYINLNMIEEARQYLNLVADNQPQELPVRMALFSMALEANDEEGMKSAQDKILQVVGDKTDSAWLSAEARRKIWQMRRGQLSRDALPEIRSLVKRAMEQRAESSDLYALLAEVELLSNNPALALKSYDRAEELGRLAPTAVAAHIRLLALSGRYAEAAKLLDRIPESVRQPLLGPLYAEILFQSKQVDAAIEQARAATVADPTNAQSQYWYSQLLARSAQDAKMPEATRKETMAKATQAMQKAAQLQPEFAEAWFALINYLLMQDKENEAQKAMRDAQLSMSGDNLTLFLARSYEALRRWFDAETMYRELYETKPDDLQRAQQLAAFYMGPLYPRPDRREKATPLINQILKAGADGKLAANDNSLLWARRMAAKMLAMTGDYQNSVKAEKLLRSNSQDGSLLMEDKLALAELLAPRPEPRSRKVAIGLLEELDRIQPLNEAGAIQLAELYYATGADWSKYQGKMELAINRYPNSARARDAYARKLLARGDAASIDRAVAVVGDLQRIAPGAPATFDLTVRIADKRGQQKQVAEALRRRLPNLDDPTKELDAATKQSAILMASLLTDLKDYDSAEKIYRSLTARDPNLSFDLARFLGMHRSPEQCFEMLSGLYKPDNVSQVLDVAMAVARLQRDKTGDKFDAQIQRWIDAGLRENPDAVSMLIVQADLYDLQKRYEDTANLYRKLLDRKELVGIPRAVVLNNLAFILPLSEKSPANSDAMKLVAEATEILGPSSDILDTRAVVLMSLDKYKEAIADLQLSVTDNPTPAKYFHLAKAYLGANNSRAAVEAWEKAEGLGLTRDSLNRMEFDDYEKVKAEITKIRGPVTKSDPVRKAG